MEKKMADRYSVSISVLVSCFPCRYRTTSRDKKQPDVCDYCCYYGDKKKRKLNRNKYIIGNYIPCWCPLAKTPQRAFTQEKAKWDKKNSEKVSK